MKMRTTLILILVIAFGGLSLQAQRNPDILIMSNNDTVLCNVEQLYEGMLLCRFDKKTVKVILIDQVDYIHLNSKNEINLSHIIDKTGKVIRGAGQWIEVPCASASDSMQYVMSVLSDIGHEMNGYSSRVLTANVLFIPAIIAGVAAILFLPIPSIACILLCTSGGFFLTSYAFLISANRKLAKTFHQFERLSQCKKQVLVQ